MHDMMVTGQGQRQESADADGDPALAVGGLARPGGRSRSVWIWSLIVAVSGPGLVVMLADTDAGSIITAAQSGAQWGYTMIVPQLALVPVLFVVQEMTVRLGVHTGAGHGALIRQRFGTGWALVSAGTLFAASIGALVTEFAAVAGVGQLFGISRWVTVPVAVAFLAWVTLSGSYRQVEKVGIALGLAEVAFVAAMLISRPGAAAVGHGLESLPLGNSSYRYLLAANVGAVIMPWMIFYQQRAVIDKGINAAGIRRERRITAAGALLTQLIMIAVVVSVAAAARRGGGAAGSLNSVSLTTVGQISGALRPILGAEGARVVLAVGMLGAALVAALVSSLAGAWGLSEIFGWEHTLNRRPDRETARFYGALVLAYVAAAALVLASVDLIALAVSVEVMNALLLPIVLGFLLALEAKALPPEHRMRGRYRWVAYALCATVIVCGLSMLPLVIGSA